MSRSAHRGAGDGDRAGKVRVTFQTESTQIGGAEHSLARVIGHLGPRVEAEVIVGSHQVGEFLAAHGAVRRVRVAPPIRATWHVHRALRIAAAVLASRPQILHVNQTWIWARPVAICAGLIAPGARVVLVEHNQPHPTPSRNRVKLARWVASRLAAWVAMSDRSARLIESLVELPAGSVRTVYNGVEPVAESDLARPDNPVPTIGAIGRLSHEKGYDLLLAALARMPGVRAVIVGDGPQRGQLEALVAELGLDERVRLTGSQSDVRSWLRSFDVLAAPSRAEGSPPLAVLEAMMAGVPVVAAEVGGVPEAVSDGATGLLVPSDDPAALAASLTRLLGDPELRRRLVDAGRHRARERFTTSRMGAEFEALYDDVLAARGAPGIRSSAHGYAAQPMRSRYRTLLAGRLRRLPGDLVTEGRRLPARVASRRGAGQILFYHRVATPARDPWCTSVAPRTLDAQLEMLAAEMRVLPLPEMIEAARHGGLPERAVAITFDDGYVDNLTQALPLLERHGLPATFYVATGFLDQPGPYWWDEIADLMVGEGPRPERLEIDLGGTRVSTPTRTLEERQEALYGEIDAALKKLRPERIDAALEPLRDWAGREERRAELSEDELSEPRPMSRAELAELASSDLVKLGAHTALHASLPALTPAEQLREIVASRDTLAEVSGERPTSFAYPFGDNDRTTRRAAREAGFDHAVGVRDHTPLTAAAPDFELPRTMAREESPSVLQKRMHNVLAFARRR